MWLAFNNKILCNEIRQVRHLTNDRMCSICGAETESVIHTLRDCTNAKMVWKILMIDGRFRSSWNLPREEWFAFNLISCKNIKLGEWDWPSLFANVCWQIWKWRNRAIFSSLDIPINKKVEIIGKLMKEWKEKNVRNEQGKERTVTYVKWEKPATNWVKLNTDGSWDQTKHIATAGGLFRDSKGLWLGGFGYNIGDCSIDMAELWAIYHGIQYARQLNIDYLEIESDSYTSIQFIKNGINGNHPLFPLVSSIKGLLDGTWNWRLSHVPREKNKAADWLAKWSISQDRGVKILSRPPKEIQDILQADCNGVCFSRYTTL